MIDELLELQALAPEVPAADDRVVAAARAALASKISAHGSAETGEVAASTAPRSWRRGRPLIRRVRQLSLLAQFAWLAVSLSTLGGVTTAVYLGVFGGAAPARQLPSVECQVGPADAVSPAVTGDPVIDCSTFWSQATGGLVAPPLSAWTRAYGGVAVVRPTSAGPPAASGWRRLPRGWTINLSAVELNDQLYDISSVGLNGDLTCTRPGPALRRVRSLLNADGLNAWHITLRANNGPLSSGCRHVAADIHVATRTVALIQIQREPPPKHVQPATRQAVREDTAARNRYRTMHARINRLLDRTCQTVPAAAALWRREAAAARLKPTTPNFWRAIQNRQPVPASFFSHYTLVEQPATQHTGRCAHLIIDDITGAPLIYIARLAP